MDLKRGMLLIWADPNQVKRDIDFIYDIEQRDFAAVNSEGIKFQWSKINPPPQYSILSTIFICTAH